MFKKLLFSVFPFFAGSCDKPQKSSNNVQKIDPREILFSLATLCDPIPSTLSGLPPSNHKHLHEDDWRQIEFVPVTNRENIRLKLGELAAFKQQHWRGQGFTQIFIRPEHPITFQSSGFAAAQLPHLTEFPVTLGSVTPPNGLGGGIVPGGFALSDSGDWFIYGQRSPDGLILSLAVSPGHAAVPSETFVQALSEVAGTRFLLVDWYIGTVVDTTSRESIRTWARRFQ